MREVCKRSASEQLLKSVVGGSVVKLWRSVGELCGTWCTGTVTLNTASEVQVNSS